MAVGSDRPKPTPTGRLARDLTQMRIKSVAAADALPEDGGIEQVQGFLPWDECRHARYADGVSLSEGWHPMNQPDLSAALPKRDAAPATITGPRGTGRCLGAAR